MSGCATAQPAPPAPCADPAHRQFDFWIGEWTVTLPNGTAAGQNRIESVDRGCVLQEHWISTGGFSGRSLNTYDASRKVWHQTWVDASGTLLLLEGGMRNGKMVLEGEQGGARNRITWSPQTDGSVRQVWESSPDGKTWTPAFDGLYRKTNKLGSE